MLLKFKGKRSKIVWDFGKFQDVIRTLSRGKSVGPYNSDYYILPLEPDHKDKVYELVTNQISHLRPLVESVGLLKAYLVIDKNGESDSKMFRKLEKEILIFVKNRFKGYKPTVEVSGDKILVHFKENKICYRLFAVPNSLEREIFKKYRKHTRFKRHTKRISDPDEAIYVICNQIYECNQEKQFREAVELLKDDGWFKALLDFL